MPTLSDKSDEQLMRLYLGGDSLAFEEIYRRFAPRLYRYIQQRVRDQAQADELFQATFLKFHASRGQFRRGEPLAPWLFTLAKNSTRDWARRKAVEANCLNSLVAQPAHTETTTSMEGVLSHPVLTSREREVLSMRFEQDLPFSRIAAFVGASVVSVRQMSHRAIAKLKRAISERKDL